MKKSNNNSQPPRDDWWHFMDDPSQPATGEFRAEGFHSVGRLYFPLVNEAGMLSWTTPQLQGGPALSHNEYLTLPVTAEDLPFQMIQRDFWVVLNGEEPFSLAGRSPADLYAHLDVPQGRGPSRIEAGPGWFRLTRKDPQNRFEVSGTLWCPADDKAPIELIWVQVTNTGQSAMPFMPYAAVPVFGRSADNVRDHRHVTSLLHRVSLQKYGVTVTPTMSFDERGHLPNSTQYTVLAFGSQADAPEGIWAVQEHFLGEGGHYSAPKAVWKRENGPATPQTSVQGQEAIGGFRFRATEIEPGGTAQFLLLCGISRQKTDIDAWTKWARQPLHWKKSLARTRRFWQEETHKISFTTADKHLDNWLIWVNLQPQLRRLYGNSYLPQFDYGRGGRGWRDLWQDCLAFLLSDPSSVRGMLIHNMGGVRIDGSNATIIAKDGRFIGDRNNIPRTWMDHGVWPTHTILLYIHQTGDAGILFEECGYFSDAQLFRCRKRNPEWTEKDGIELRAKKGIYQSSILEHLLIQNVTAFFNVGEHNLCRLEGADWNDGLDMAQDRGESVAFSAFYAWNLMRLASLLEDLSEKQDCQTILVCKELLILLDRLPGQSTINYRSARAKQKHLDLYLQTVASRFSGKKVKVKCEDVIKDLKDKYEDLKKRISRQEWIQTNKAAFFNGYYDNEARRVEGDHPKGLRMTLTGQVFPILSRIADEDQVDQTVKAVNRFLRDKRLSGVRLNTDFHELQPHLGRAFFFAYGEKENGAVFSHMAVMYAYALYARRRPEEGRKVWHELYRKAADQHTGRVFPGLPEYFNARGRGLYTYLTGSASWLGYLLLTEVYGVRGRWGDLIIDPQLMPDDFDQKGEASVKTIFAGRSCHVTFKNIQRLKPAAYRIQSCQMNHTEIPFQVLPHGIRIPRCTLEKGPINHPIHLLIKLGK